jgi:hypothetical protein
VPISGPPAGQKADTPIDESAESHIDVRHSCQMASKVPTPRDIKAAAQAAAETAQAAAETAQAAVQSAADSAQAAAGAALRIPPASIQLMSQLPDLIENLATATERLNTAIDRAERYLALADPMIRTMDAVLPQLEALVATGNEVYGAVSSLPGVATLSRLATRGSAPAAEKPSKGRSTPKKPGRA